MFHTILFTYDIIAAGWITSSHYRRARKQQLKNNDKKHILLAGRHIAGDNQQHLLYAKWTIYVRKRPYLFNHILLLLSHHGFVV